jgi:hypothetical protein
MVAAYWMLLAARMVDARPVAQEPNLSTWIDLAATNRTLDPENAFWPQIESVLLWKKGDRAESIARWVRASKSARWDDYQNDRLIAVENSLAKESGASYAWHWALMYRQREDAIAIALFRHTTRMVQVAREAAKTDYPLLMASLRNARLLRDGSKRLDTHAAGQQAVDACYQSENANANSTERKQHEARLALINEFKDFGAPGDSNEVASILRDNAAWSQILDRIPAEKNHQASTLLSLAYSTLPTSLMVSAILGAILTAGSILVKRVNDARQATNKTFLFAGIALGLLACAVTQRISLGVVVLLVFAFLATTANTSQRPIHVNVISERVLRTTWVMVVLCAGWFMWCTQSTGWQYLSGTLPVSSHLGGRSGQAVLLECWILLLPFIFAATMARMQRRSSAVCLHHTLNTCGPALLVWSVGFAIVLGTVATVADHRLANDLEQVTLNEPLYYFREP